MPVSTFSSGNSTRHHGAMIERWNSTRERMTADERRRSESGPEGMQEMDGTGLYERPDWPLPSPPSRDGDDKQDEKIPAVVETRNVDENAVMRKSEEIGGWENGNGTYGEEPDISDVEEEEEEEDSGEGAHEHGISPPAVLATTSDQLQFKERRVSRDDGDGSPATGNTSAYSRLSRVMEDLAAVEQKEHDVSPVRNEDHSPRNISPQVSPNRPEEEQQPDASAQDDRLRQDQQDLGFISIHEPQDEETASDEELEELRDVATPIPFTNDSPRLRQGSSSTSAPSTPQPNGTSIPTTNGHSYRGSIAKSPMMAGHRRTPTASSMHSTTQLPANRDRVRYSWQSLQDDEPNRPRIHIIKLVSNTVTAAAGFPQGEAFGFSISPGGKRIAAFNSARLYVLQTAALPVGISQDYALKRRPLAVEITDEANVIAILADDHTINIYELGPQRLQRTRTITLDFPTTCIALAPTGGLVAAAYEGGVEVFSLAAGALPTDRRAVRSVKMDRLVFSDDGATLLGTTTRIHTASTVIVSVPVFPASPDGVPSHEELKEAWCTELLQPENIRNSSHATFMRENEAACNDRLFAWNGLADTFGILNANGLEYGNIDFPVVISPPLSTCGGLGAAIHSCPAIDEHGDTVAMIVNDRTIRLYIVPRRIDGEETSIEAHSIDHELDEGYGCPFSEARWVYSSASTPVPAIIQTNVKGRLIVTSPGGVIEGGNAEEMLEDIEGGRIIMFDFDPQYAGQPGQTFSLTLGKSPPQLLEEEQMNVAEQVSLVRRRTVNQGKSGGLSQRPIHLGRAATTFGNGRELRSASPALYGHLTTGRTPRASMLSIGSMQSEAAQSLPDLAEGAEQADAEAAAFEEPYAQNAPRSQASLQRAASNAQRHRFQTLEERNQERVSVDSNGAFLALPEYSEEPNAPLPSRYRAMAGLDAPALFRPEKPAVLTNPGGASSSLTSGPSSGSFTAPPDIGERFSADEVFRDANAAFGAARQTIHEHPQEGLFRARASMPPQDASSRRDTMDSMDSRFLPNGSSSIPRPFSTASTFDSISPVGRTGTFDSLASMPRSLQRAYSNAISPIGQGPSPGLIGDWRNVAPTNIHTPSASQNGIYMNGQFTAPSSTATSSIRGDETWDVISPIGADRREPPSFGARYAQNPNQYRYSTSLLNPPGHPGPARPPGSSSSFQTTLSGTSSFAASTHDANGGSRGVSTARRMPPHMVAFRNAAAAASLFPPTVPPDQIPLREPPARAGTVAHPILDWHPPAPSSPANNSNATATAHRRSGSMRGHSRRSSLAGKGAFASTTRAKRLGFFRKDRGGSGGGSTGGGGRRPPDPYAPSSQRRRGKGGEEDVGSMMETKSAVTWMTRGEGRCAVM